MSDLPDGVELLRQAIARDDGKGAAELLVEMHMALEDRQRTWENEARRRRRWLRAAAGRFTEVPSSARVDDLIGLGADDMLEQLRADLDKPRCEADLVLSTIQGGRNA